MGAGNVRVPWFVWHMVLFMAGFGIGQLIFDVVGLLR